MKLTNILNRITKASVTTLALFILSSYSTVAQTATTTATNQAIEIDPVVNKPMHIEVPKVVAPVTATKATAAKVDPAKVVTTQVEQPAVKAPAVKEVTPIKTVTTPATTTTTKPIVKSTTVTQPTVTTTTSKTVAAPVVVKPVTTTTTKPIVKSTTVTKPAVTTTTSKTVVAPVVIKPVTTYTPETKKQSKLPSTSTSRSPGYYSEKSSSSWHQKVVQEYKTMHQTLGDRIHIGLRSMNFSLEDTSRVGQNNNYLGTIDELHEVQDTSLANVTVGFYPIRNLGVEYRRDKVVAKTTTNTDNNHSDGSFKVEGPVFLGIARLPLDQIVTLFNHSSTDEAYKEGTTYNIARRFIPYIGLGIAGLSGEFNADTWWANGYSSPESWESLGSPEGIIRNGHTREIKVTDEDAGIYLVYGISIRVIDNFYADFSFSKVDVDLTSDFSLDGHYQYTKTIPMSYTSTSIGIRYYF